MLRDFHKPGRSIALGENGMAATSHPMATQAAISILKQGGHAADAAVAAGAMQAVVDPAMTGIGGDAFIIVAPEAGGVTAINGAGKTPAGINVDAIRAAGHHEITQTSPHAVTTPCAVSAWLTLHGDYGRLDLAQVFSPAIEAAEHGFVVTPRVARDFASGISVLRNSEAGAKMYLLDGRAPRTGDKLRLPQLAKTLRGIAAGGEDAFYRGGLAAQMAASLASYGAAHTIDDFAKTGAFISEPIRGTYRDLEIFQCPPSGQGVIALLMLNILECFGPGAMDPHGVDRFHLEAEATKLAFRERQAHLADPAMVDVPLERLLDKDFARTLAAKINPKRAMAPTPAAEPGHQDTIYLSVVDRDQNAVSFINSLYHGFGTGLACPETGVLFHCRGKAFTLEESHPNVLAPGKVPMHTIIPGMAFKNGQAYLSYGVMGADYQPVGQSHLISNIVDFGMDLQSAMDSPRAMAFPHDLEIESTVPDDVSTGLKDLGHDVTVPELPFGCGQAIQIDRDRGVLLGAADHRKDSVALGY